MHGHGKVYDSLSKKVDYPCPKCDGKGYFSPVPELREEVALTDEEIIVNLDLGKERKYEAGGEWLFTVDVADLLKAQITKCQSARSEVVRQGEIKMFQNFDERKALADIEKGTITFNIPYDTYVDMKKSLSEGQ